MRLSDRQISVNTRTLVKANNHFKVRECIYKASIFASARCGGPSVCTCYAGDRTWFGCCDGFLRRAAALLRAARFRAASDGDFVSLAVPRLLPGGACEASTTVARDTTARVPVGRSGLRHSRWPAALGRTIFMIFDA